MGITQMARAKVNLTLKVLGRRQDGYHEIESLVTFAAVGDRLSWRPGAPAQVLARGPFAADIDAPNILEVALGMLQQCAANLRLGAIELEKNLPVAAGLGGGSSDAGALLRLARCANHRARTGAFLAGGCPAPRGRCPRLLQRQAGSHSRHRRCAPAAAGGRAASVSATRRIGQSAGAVGDRPRVRGAPRRSGRRHALRPLRRWWPCPRRRRCLTIWARPAMISKTRRCASSPLSHR